MVNENLLQESQQVVTQLKYFPSSSEKKRAIVMYLLLGIMVMVTKPQMSVFEYYHLKQSVGWWTTFLMFVVAFAILFFVPFIKLLWLIPLVIWIALWWVFVKQSWDWNYYSQSKQSPLQFVSAIWWWLLNLFEISPSVVGIDTIPSVDWINGQLENKSSDVGLSGWVSK